MVFLARIEPLLAYPVFAAVLSGDIPTIWEFFLGLQTSPSR